MKVENIPMPSDKAFMVEAIILLDRVLIKVVDAVDSPNGAPGTTSLLATDLHARMIDITGPLADNPSTRWISTIFGTTNLSVKGPYTLEARKAEAHAKEAEAYALEAAQIELHAQESIEAEGRLEAMEPKDHQDAVQVESRSEAVELEISLQVAQVEDYGPRVMQADLYRVTEVLKAPLSLVEQQLLEHKFQSPMP